VSAYGLGCPRGSDDVWRCQTVTGPLSITRLPAPTLLNAEVTGVHDGDTFTVDISWGRRRFDHGIPIRLLGVNAAELGTPGGDAAARELANGLVPGTPVLLVDPTDDKYAPRLDAEVIYFSAGGLRDLAVDLVASFWAAPWNGHGPKPVPPWPRPTPPGFVTMNRVDAHRAVRKAVTAWRTDPR
jgi:endonuclease YncB( thermonuclease family)